MFAPWLESMLQGWPPHSLAWACGWQLSPPWLQTALLLGTTFLGAHRNGDSLLLHDLCSRPLAPLSLQDRLQEFQQLLESLRSPAVSLIVQASDEHGLLRQAALSAFEHLNVMWFSYIARLFTAFLAAVERDIIDVQMQSATRNDLAGLVFDTEGASRSSEDPH